MKLFMILSLLLASCGSETDADSSHKYYQASRKTGVNHFFPRKVKVEGDFTGYLSEFEEYYGGSVNDVSIVFGGDEPQDNAAVCTIMAVGHKVITVDREQWNNFPIFEGYRDHMRRVFIFHELGHCVLNHFGHSDGSIYYRSGDGVMAVRDSIMAEGVSAYDIAYSYKRWDEYVHALFTNTKVPQDNSQLLESSKGF